MSSGVSVTNQQPQQLGLGFPAPPGDPGGTQAFPRLTVTYALAEYRTIKERRLLFGRSKGYRDLTLAGAEPESPGERYRSSSSQSRPRWLDFCLSESTADMLIEVVRHENPTIPSRPRPGEQLPCMRLAAATVRPNWSSLTSLPPNCRAQDPSTYPYQSLKCCLLPQ